MNFTRSKKVRRAASLLLILFIGYLVLRNTVLCQDDVTGTLKRKLEVLILAPSAIRTTPSSGTLRMNKTKSHLPLFSDDVINPHPFHFIMSNKDACLRNASQGKVFLLILVKCRPKESFDRMQIRKTWGGVTTVDGVRTMTMFLIGQTTNATINAMVIEEDRQYFDLIQGNFIDDYRNLTHKTVMGWRWAAEFCPDAKYVASTDVDALLNVRNIARRLLDKPRTKYAEGHVEVHAKPFRGNATKWQTSLEMYPEPTYAPYLSGVCYVLSADVAAGVYRESAHVRFLPWDDAYVGLVLQRLGVVPKEVPGYLQFGKTVLQLEKALALGQAVIAGNDSDHVGMGVNIALRKLWERVDKKQVAAQSRRNKEQQPKS